jgi:hypothetical protein
MRAFLRDNGLAVFFFAILLASLAGQLIAGQRAFNEDAALHGSESISVSRYFLSSEFGRAVLENWQSEYLQFSLFVLATIWFVQRGSPESKDEAGTESDKDEQVGRFAPQRAPAWAKVGGWRQVLYSYSLLILCSAIFVASWAGQSVTGWTEYNDEQVEHGAQTVSWTGYLHHPQFWEETFQNWQSEFLAVGSLVIFAVFLRARGSTESKPVGTPHDSTGVSN